MGEVSDSDRTPDTPDYGWNIPSEMHSSKWNSNLELGSTELRKERNMTVKLYNVIDTRTGQFHSVAIVRQRDVKWFVPANESEEEAES